LSQQHIHMGQKPEQPPIRSHLRFPLLSSDAAVFEVLAA
jgi:hypothetical protein